MAKLENLINKDLLEAYDDELKKTYLAGGIVFDISAHKATGSPAAPATFASLTAALGTNGANIPQNMRKGGMTVKFIKGSAQSQSNKYVQYRLTTQTFSTSEADWECIEDSVSALEAAVGTGGSVDERIAAEGARHYLKAETYTKTEVNGLVDTPHQEYVTVEQYADLPATGSADTIYRVSNWDGSANSGQGAVDATVYSEYAWDGVSDPGRYVFLCVKSQIGEVFDISVYNNNAVYADLAAALGTDGANVPESLRKGGMSVKFIQGSVQSADNNYKRFDLIADEFTTDVTKWAVDDNGVYIDNEEFVCITADSTKKILQAFRKKDGTVFWGAGVPQQVIEYVTTKIKELSLDEYGDIVTFLGNLINEDETLQQLLNEKVDKEEGKSIVTSQYVQDVENEEWTSLLLDSNNKIIEGVKKNGKGKFVSCLINNYQESYYSNIKNGDIEKVNIKGGSATFESISLSNDALASLAQAMENAGLINNSTFYLVNPYEGVNWDNRVAAQSHEHCYNKSTFENAYNRGIRVFAASHYVPSLPRVPMSDFANTYTYKDLKSVQAVLDGDYEMIDRAFPSANTPSDIASSIPTLTINGNNIDTDTIPQIANAERGFVKDANNTRLGHMNILGLLWASAGNAMCDYEIVSSSPSGFPDVKFEYSLETLAKFNELLEDEVMWQFGSRYAFGTINHCDSAVRAKKILDGCPSIFKGFELFNDNSSPATNEVYRNQYDILLGQGYKLWGTSVVDHQGSVAPWKNLTTAEKNYWEDLAGGDPSVDTDYTLGRAYYAAHQPYKYDKGCNVMLMDATYNNMSAQNKAKEIMKAYLSGNYYMSAQNTKSMKLTCNGNLVTFKVSDFADRMYVITANGRSNAYTNTDTITYLAQRSDKFIRFEAFWEDETNNYYEFVFSNPVWVEEID